MVKKDNNTHTTLYPSGYSQFIKTGVFIETSTKINPSTPPENPRSQYFQ